MLTTIKTTVLNTWRAGPERQLASLRKNKFLVEFCWGAGEDKGRGIVPGSYMACTRTTSDYGSLQQGG